MKAGFPAFPFQPPFASIVMAYMRPIELTETNLGAELDRRAELASPGFLASPIAALKAWYKKQVAAAELMSLDDRLLKDIGLNRSDIPKVVSGAYFSDNTQIRSQSTRR
jgi:uncharacterized protein YjiS (DUF1127 family)